MPSALPLSGLLVFLGAYALAVLSPGPAAAAVVARALATGTRRTLPFVAGIVLGDLVWFALVALGLAALAAAFQGLFAAVRYAGCLYLLWMAYKLWTAPAQAPGAAPRAAGEGWRLLLGGLSLTLGNPKVMVFFLAILPAVVDLDRLTPLAFAQVAGLIVVTLTAAMLAYALTAERARRLVSTPRAVRRMNRATGAVMAGAAAAIAARG